MGNDFITLMELQEKITKAVAAGYGAYKCDDEGPVDLERASRLWARLRARRLNRLAADEAKREMFWAAQGGTANTATPVGAKRLAVA